jgi:hypothetical protein
MHSKIFLDQPYIHFIIGHDGHYQKVSTTDAILSAYHDTWNWQEHVQYVVSLYDAKLHMACEIKVG